MRFLSFGTIAGHADTYQLFNINGSGVYPTPGPRQGQTDTVSGTVVIDLTTGAFYNLTGSSLGPIGELLSGTNPFEFRFLTNSLVGYTGSGFQMVQEGTQLFLFGSVTPTFDTIGVFDFTLTQVPGDRPVAKQPITGFTLIDTTSGTVELIDVKCQKVGGPNGENISGYLNYNNLFNAVTDIKVVDTTIGYTIADLGNTFTSLQVYTAPAGPSAYQWNVDLPGQYPYQMNWWFRTMNASNVPHGVVPTSLEAANFEYLHNFGIYYATGQHPTVISADLSNTPSSVPTSVTPEPGTLLLLETGLLSLAGTVRRRLG